MSAMRAAQVVSARFRFLDTGGGSPAVTYVSQAAHAAPGCGTSSRRTPSLVAACETLTLRRSPTRRFAARELVVSDSCSESSGTVAAEGLRIRGAETRHLQRCRAHTPHLLHFTPWQVHSMSSGRRSHLHWHFLHRLHLPHLPARHLHLRAMATQLDSELVRIQVVLVARHHRIITKITNTPPIGLHYTLPRAGHVACHYCPMWQLCRKLGDE